MTAPRPWPCSRTARLSRRGLPEPLTLISALARYDDNGTLDPGFGTGGRVTTDFAGFSDTAYAVAVQPDGRIVAARIGRCYQHRL
jgi:hypothetical protein